MVEVTAAEMRRALGLLPWPVQEARAKVRIAAYLAAGGYPDPDPYRQTGRTTRGTLLALAGCRVRGLGTVHVTGNLHVVRVVKDMVRALGLQVQVVTGDLEYHKAHITGRVLFYQDHHLSPRL